MPKYLLSKLDSKNFRLCVNCNIPDFPGITNALQKFDIPFIAIDPLKKNNKFPATFAMSFSPLCNMDDIYYLANFFSHFGVCEIYPKRPNVELLKDKTIIVNTYDEESDFSDDSVIAAPIPMYQFLEIDLSNISTWSFVHHWFMIKKDEDRIIFKKMAEAVPGNPRRRETYEFNEIDFIDDRDKDDAYGEYLTWLKDEYGEDNGENE